MKKFLIITSVLFMLSGCSYKIVRSGYQTTKSAYKPCDILLQKSIVLTNGMQKVGTIQLKDNGFTSQCSESDAITLLKNEGCALNAQLIYIKEETRPNVSSTCYRCKAEFYKVADGIIMPDDSFSDDNIKKRESSDRKKNNTIIWTSVAVGLFAGLMLSMAN